MSIRMITMKHLGSIFVTISLLFTGQRPMCLPKKAQDLSQNSLKTFAVPEEARIRLLLDSPTSEWTSQNCHISVKWRLSHYKASHQGGCGLYEQLLTYGYSLKARWLTFSTFPVCLWIAMGPVLQSLIKWEPLKLMSGRYKVQQCWETVPEPNHSSVFPFLQVH